MKQLLYVTALFLAILTSCQQRSGNNAQMTSTTSDSIHKEELEDESNIGKLRQEYISNYDKVNLMDTSIKDSEGRKIHVYTKYYCSFDNAIIIPQKYVWETSNKSFKTHNFLQDITIVIEQDTLFNKTFTKSDFSDFLYPELKKYAVLMFLNFTYDKQNNLFNFDYSISIPITDVGIGCRLTIDKKGQILKSLR